VYHYNGAQWYKQFLQVGRLDRALTLLGLALYLSSASVSSVFLLTPFLPFKPDLSLILSTLSSICCRFVKSPLLPARSTSARYTLATKLNSTRLTLLQVDKVDCVALAAYTLATKSKGRSTFGRQKLPTFDKVDRVEHFQLW